MIPHRTKIGVLICTPIPYVTGSHGRPVHDTITIQWHRARSSLSFPTNFAQIEAHRDGMPVAEARNSAVHACLEHDPNPEFIFFLDYDVIAPWDAFTKLVYRARHYPECDLFAGVYTPKWMSPPEPIIYCGDGGGAFWDWTVGDILTTDSHGITGTHMGCTLIRTSLFERFPWDEENPWFVTTDEKHVNKKGTLVNRRGTEDLWFCREAREKADLKILIDTGVLCGHIDKNTGIEWALPYDSKPVKNAHWLPKMGKEYTENGYTKEYVEEKKALDIGCGDRKRSWEGHKTYRLDIRPEVEPDYCQDSTMLNLPDEHFDLVASSHHLEHLGRWDQEKVWQEMARVLKPGGRMEHVIPNLEWAAKKIADGDIDEHVMNVLYGAQEEHGYARDFNTHYFGYTPQIAKELAEAAGLVDVEVKTYEDDENLLFEMVLTATKPAEVDDEEVPEGFARSDIDDRLRKAAGADAQSNGEHEEPPRPPERPELVKAMDDDGGD